MTGLFNIKHQINIMKRLSVILFVLATVAADVYGVNSIPDNILINPEGKIVARGLRGTELDAFLSSVL